MSNVEALGEAVAQLLQIPTASLASESQMLARLKDREELNGIGKLTESLSRSGQ